MKVSGLWRYPVKSMRGERQASADFNQRGVDGDRRFGVLDLSSGTIVTAKNDERMLEARSLLAGVTLTIRLPTGETVLGTGPAVDMALSSWLGRSVRLVEARPNGRGHSKCRRTLKTSVPGRGAGSRRTGHSSTSERCTC